MRCFRWPALMILFVLAATGAAGDDALKLRIFYTTDFHGALEPCG